MSYIEQVNIFMDKNKNLKKKKKKKVSECEPDYECIPKKQFQYNPSNRVFQEPNKPKVFFQPNTNKNTFRRGKPYNIIRKPFTGKVKEYRDIDESIVAPLFLGGQRRIKVAEQKRKEITEQLRKKYAYEDIEEESKEEIEQQESKEEEIKKDDTSKQIKSSMERIKQLTKNFNKLNKPLPPPYNKPLSRKSYTSSQTQEIPKPPSNFIPPSNKPLPRKSYTASQSKAPSFFLTIPEDSPPEESKEEEKEEINFLEKEMKPQLSILKNIGEESQQEPIFLGGDEPTRRVSALERRFMSSAPSSDEDIGAEQYELEEMLGENYAGRELTEEPIEPQNLTVADMVSNIERNISGQTKADK